jgi:superfamily II DNA or RNA helicase
MSDTKVRDEPIEQHLPVSGLIVNIIRDLGIRTVGDLCSLDIKTVEQVKGVGVKKIAELKHLIEMAQQLAGISLDPVSDTRIELTGTVFEQASLLVFVPSILKVAFEQIEIDTVGKLFATDVSELDALPGWGEKKKAAAAGIKELYSRLAAIKPDADIRLVGDIVPNQVLPAENIGRMLLDKFINGRYGDELRGKALQEAHDLRMLLTHVFAERSNAESIVEMEWRDVPLQVSVKVEAVADRYNLVTVRQLDDFALHGRVVDPQTQNLVDVTRERNFGESSLTGLREELRRFKSVGLKAYRQQLGCSFDVVEIAEMLWCDVPLKVNKRIIDFLRSEGIEKISEVHQVALRKQVFSRDQNKWLPISEFANFSDRSVNELRDELAKLDSHGLDHYRFGKDGVPRTLDECIARALAELNSRQIEIVKARCSGATLDEAAQEHSLTRERARQISKSAFKRLQVYRFAAQALIEKHLRDLPRTLLWEAEYMRSYFKLREVWHLDFLLELTELGHERLNARAISRIPKKNVDLLTDCLRKLTRNDPAFSLSAVSAIGEVLLAFNKAMPSQISYIKSLEEFADCELSSDDIRSLLGDDWLRASIRSQVVDAGMNGIAFSDIDMSGTRMAPSELEQFLKGEAVRLEGDTFRRPGEMYERVEEILEIVRAAPGPVDVEYIILKSSRPWHQPVLVGRYLSPLYEVVNTGRGLYLHIQKLNLSVNEVKQIAHWGAALLAGELRSIDGNELLDLYHSSGLPQKIENAYQLVSILAKHSDVRRLSNNLQLAHRISFDETELSLAKADPEIAAQWHPTKNGSVMPDDVRPNSFKKRWWKCSKGHEFEAMPVYRTRMIRSCPGCQDRWNLAKVRHFVASLRPHLDALTPAELYVIFQQSGLLSHGGQSRGFVKALATGRFPQSELDKFIDGTESLVDEFIDEQSMALESPAVVDTLDEIEDSDSGKDQTTRKEEEDTSVKLPTVSTKKAIAALDCPAIASTDVEAVDFLIASAKAKIWSHAFRDSRSALREIEHAGATEYSQRVRNEFLTEFNEASQLIIPPGYTFALGENIIQPNLMQRHVAFEIFKRKRFGNWSGTGAGKTLSAVLASRVCDARMTVIWCPNAVVGEFQSGWSGEIRRIFSDSDIAIKTWTPEWKQGSQHRYLVMNYEQLQQPSSESELKHFLDSNNIDFIVIDEVHYAKQRYVDQLSQRKRLLQAMVSEAGRKNTEMRVLGMSATPVINNLQEGRSLIEMITGVEHNDLPTKPTVANCMRLHQQLARLGTRWRPEYEPSLIVETPEVNCEAWIDEIRDLGRNASPLAIEKILTQARIPSILEGLKRSGRTLIYTHYVDEIAATLYDAIANAGFRVGFYTGESKQGLEQFKSGEIDVLIGSSSIGTGVDGLQLVCDRVIINCLPWTNAEYEQLIGRLWRQGQTSKKVEVIVPLTYASVNGARWSYCDSKLQRIRYKKSVADAAVDGAVPEGNLRSPAQAQSDILAWLERLESGEELTIQRRPIVVPLSDVGAAAEKRLARYGDFSTMNARWNNAVSSKTSNRLQTTPEEWEQYHTLYRKARENWAVVPFQEFIRWCKNREGYVIADFGCGEALVAKAVSDRHTVHSFDHVAIDESVIEGDMAKTNLDPESVDVALFSLSLMGSNFTDYLREAYRVLKIDGQLHIWEAVSRFDDVKRFAKSLEQLAFQVFEPRIKEAFVLIEGRKTERQADITVELRFRELRS